MILTDPATMTTPNRYDRLRGNEAFPCVCLRVSNPPRRTTVIDTDQRIAEHVPPRLPVTTTMAVAAGRSNPGNTSATRSTAWF